MADRSATFEVDDALLIRAHAHMGRGFYDSIDHVFDAAFEALDREARAFDEMVRKKVDEALADPRPPIPMAEAFARLDAAKARRRA